MSATGRGERSPESKKSLRSTLVIVLATLLLVGIPLAAHPNTGPIAYKIEIDKVFRSSRERDGKKALFVTVQFRIHRLNPDGSVGPITIDVPRDQIAVDEDQKRVADLEMFQPRVQNLTTVLALDESGSMASHGKMGKAIGAANLFLDKLDANADTGLILFDHLLRVRKPPAGDKSQFAEHRKMIKGEVNQAKPQGGTAYLDATAAAVGMLKGTPGRKVVVLMTDGVDIHSKQSMEDVINAAQALGVPIYTIGIGQPGKNEPVTTVLVLDHSGSMKAPANNNDTTPKIKALHSAAGQFVELMRPGAKTTLLPFSGTVSKPEPFTSDKAALKNSILQLKAEGGTLLYDATYAGLETLVAARPVGKKAVVVLTDGKDESPGSRRSDKAVVARAKEAGIPLHMLALGRPGEFNREVMEEMARATGGSFHHAEDEKKLFEIFEQLSIDLHDDGIDETALRELAKETGGQYFPAEKIDELHLIYDKLATELQTTYTVTFPSRRSKHDGTARGIDISVVRDGVRISDIGSVDVNVHGVVPAEMDPAVYLSLLAGLGVLLAIPVGVRTLLRPAKVA